jgi:3-dehydroquinate synthase
LAEKAKPSFPLAHSATDGQDACSGLMRTVRVNLGERSYDIVIGAQLLSRLGQRLRPLNLGARCLVIADINLERLGLLRKTTDSLAAAGFKPMSVSGAPGETSKTLDQANIFYRACAAHQLDRDSFIVALGGGVVGDVAGFVAATYLRGISLVQVPTTLLAQVDSSVGGKVGVDLPEGKNLVGAFWQPRGVFADLETLQTLPPRQFSAGMAELIKTAAIKDAALFQQLEENLEALLRLDLETLAAVIARCCEIKAEIVAADERETKGHREILNYGHTLGHAIEAAGGYHQLLHGEAISIGMVFAARLSARHAGLCAAEVRRLTRLLQRCNLPTALPPEIPRDEILRRIRLDKKIRAGKLRFVLLKRLGEAVATDAIQEKDLLDTLR